MNTIVTAITVFVRPGPREAPTAMASRMAGNAYSTSIARISAADQPTDHAGRDADRGADQCRDEVGTKPATSDSRPP